MQIKEIMTPGVEVVHPDTNLKEVATKMKELDVGSLPVCDGDRLKGMITDRDITIRAIAEGRDPNSARTSDVMTPRVVYCFEDQDVNEVAKVMENEKIRRLPVLNRDKRLVGIVSLGDLAVDTGRKEMSGEALREISQPARPER